MSESRNSWLEIASHPAIVRSSLRVAAIVGTILVAINYGDRLFAGTLSRVDWAKMLMTYFVPYSVATYSAVQALRRRG
jgi:hypothetical protein